MNLRRVILAIDPYFRTPAPIQQTVAALGALTRGHSTRIEPVSVVHPRDFTLTDLFFGKVDELADAVREELEKRLASLSLPGMEPPKILVARPLSSRNAVLPLLRYAEETGTDLIALSRHGRSSLARSFMGSFAESMALRSAIPLLVVDPHQRVVPKRLHGILFPTDLSEKSREGLEKVSRATWESESEIHLFHQVEPLPSLPVDGLGPLPIPQISREKLAAEAYATLNRWAKEVMAEMPGVRCSVRVSEESAPLLPALLSEGRRWGAGMIAMVSEVGPFGAIVAGSLTRQVLRHSRLPVWVVHV
jgi:nucleotide-binding universal stress UspA family protein